MTTAETTLRRARLLHLVFLATVCLYIFILAGGIFKPVAAVAISPLAPAVLAFAAVTDIAIAVGFRKRLIDPNLERIRQNPEDTTSLNRWRGIHSFHGVRGNDRSFWLRA